MVCSVRQNEGVGGTAACSLFGRPGGEPTLDVEGVGGGDDAADGGAARFALEHFGAVYGQGRGLQGKSYAIPTMSGSLAAIAREVEDFIWFADSHPDLTFLVTRIGCGIAGYSDEEIAPLFARAYSLPNVYLPAEFWKVLSYKYR